MVNNGMPMSGQDATATDDLGGTSAATSAVTVLRHSDHLAMPWKNGAGTTYEVARHPRAGDAFDWRVSFAEVNEPGPFSTFPGIDRVITLVQGTSMALAVTPASGAAAFDHVLLPYEPFTFAGEDVVSSVPGGPTLDLNVMTARGRVVAEVTRLVGDAEIDAPSGQGERVLIACLAAGIELKTQTEGAVLAALDVAELGVQARCSGDGVALLIRLRAL